VRRSYVFRLRPTARQHVALRQCLDDHRALYNAALEERRGRWRWNRERVRYGDQSAQLKAIRECCPSQARWSFSSQQTTLRRLNRAFENFFRRTRVGESAGFPRFKSQHRWDSVEWPRDGDGCRFKPEHRQVYLQGIGSIRVTMHRPVEGMVKTIAVKREGRRWFVVLACDDVAVKPLPPTGAHVGVDMGVTAFAATSDGQLVGNPRYGRKAAVRLASAQEKLARKKRGSNNRRRQRAVVANRHRKVARQRRNFHHLLARRLITAYEMIVIEDLAVKNMTRSAAGTIEAPGVNVSAKSSLNRSILDAGWAQFASILTDKAEEAGRRLIKVNPRRTSQMHSTCGLRGTRDGVAFWCPHCSIAEHADVNAARNVLRAGLALLAADAA
jgi:putative transposase